MNRIFVRDNITTVSIGLFVLIFASIQLLKPSFLYKSDGSAREFGIGYRSKTILPIWLLSVVLGILSYLIVLYYIAHPKIHF
jgi:hypothetical protein